MLSLSPRFDLYKFEFPRDWIPEEIQEKYQNILNRTPGVLMDPVSYLNESIQQITIPSMNELNIIQVQHSFNKKVIQDKGAAGLGKLHIEPRHENFYKSTSNPLENIDREFTVTLRQNQGLLNYFMLWEVLMYHAGKAELYSKGEDIFYIDFLSETGSINFTMNLYQPMAIGIDGLDFSYSKTDRPVETFDVKFNFNNIDIDFSRVNMA